MGSSFKVSRFGVVLTLIFVSSLIVAGFYFDVEYTDLIQAATFSGLLSNNTLSPNISPSTPISDGIRIPDSLINIEDVPLSGTALRELWQCLFYHLILRPKYFSEIDSDFPLNLESRCKSSGQSQNSKLSLNDYLHWTNMSISTLSSSNDYRSLLSVRRYMLMISMQSDSEYSEIFESIMVLMDALAVETQRYIMKSIENRGKKYFNIHVVKSAGSTVCRTFNALGFATSSPNSLNCNVRSTNSAWKLPDFGVVPCSSYFGQSKKYDMIAFERPMHGQGEINTKDLRQPTDFIVKREVLAPNTSSAEVKQRILFWIKTINRKHEIQPVCTMKVFDIVHPQTREHLIYSPLYLASDFETFFQKLYSNEAGDDTLTQLPMTAKYGDRTLCWRNEGVYRLYWFGKEKYSQFAFKVANNWTSNSKQKIEKLNIDFVRGWMANLYVRSMGYEHAEGVSYDALYAKNAEITTDHFVNAVHLMSMIDYIMPFEKVANHTMWRHVFDLIKDQHNHTEIVEDWLHANEGSHRKQDEQWLNSQHIERAMTDDDRRVALEVRKLL